MNNLLLIIGMIALSNGNISLGNLPLFDNKKNSKGENIDNKRSRERKTRDNVRKKVKKKTAAAKTTTATLPITSFRVLILLDVFIYRSSCILLDFAAKP